VVEAARLMREEHIGSLPENETKTGELVEAISTPSEAERR
jgi:hypothetical protein